MGNPLRGDDAAGGLVSERLIRKHTQTPDPTTLILTVATSLESFSGRLRRFAPHYILVVDAADFDGKPGEVSWLDWRDAASGGPSTHLHSLSLTAEFLERELRCEVHLLGIQPLSLEFDTGLDPRVSAAVDELAAALAAALLE